MKDLNFSFPFVTVILLLAIANLQFLSYMNGKITELEDALESEKSVIRTTLGYYQQVNDAYLYLDERFEMEILNQGWRNLDKRSEDR